MARQRFIWPSIWDDPAMGVLSDGARLLYIGCFSLADDDGRMIGDPIYLKTQVFRYRPTTPDEVREFRDQLTVSCSNFIVYEVENVEYIAFANWAEFQKPKYPKPSRLPRPPRVPKRRKPASLTQKPSGNDSGSDSGNDSPEIPGIVPEAIPPWVGLGRDGLGRDGTGRETHKDPSFLPTSTTDPESEPADGKDGRNENGKHQLPDLDNILKEVDAA